MAERGLDKRQVISELTRSPHGKLGEFIPMGAKAASEDPAFFNHLIAWNNLKGEIRDSKVALPIIALKHGAPDYHENALAHLAALSPRDLLKALDFAYSIKPSRGKMLQRLVNRYLKDREATPYKWDRMTVQHRQTVKSLYARYHIKPSDKAKAILFEDRVEGHPVFEAIRNLAKMTPVDAAGAILKYKIPFLVASSSLGKMLKQPALVMAIIERMSPTELVTNSKMLERLGVRETPSLRAAYDEALEKAADSKRARSSLKATRAAEVLEEEDPIIALKLRALQEKQFEKIATIDGDWLVLGDKSFSMNTAIEVAAEVAAVLCRSVKGKVHLVFFDSMPYYVDVTGRTYEEIKTVTRQVHASGATSIGCGLSGLMERKLTVDGIAVISDAQENMHPFFASEYTRYCKINDTQPPVYLYRLEPGSRGHSDRDLKRSMADSNHDLVEFDLRGKSSDRYSLPNLVQTMRVNRYDLTDEIMAADFLKLDDILKNTTDIAVLPKELVVV